MIIGILIVVIPFLGFPSGLIRFIEVICGLLVTGLAYSMAPKIDLDLNQKNVPFKDHRSALAPTSTSSTASVIPESEITNSNQEQR